MFRYATGSIGIHNVTGSVENDFSYNEFLCVIHCNYRDTHTWTHWWFYQHHLLRMKSRNRAVSKDWWKRKDRRRNIETERENKHRLRFTCVTLVTVADNLSVTVVLVTRSSKVASTVGPVWTGAWATLTTGRFAQNWVTIVTIGTPTERTKEFTQVNSMVKGETGNMQSKNTQYQLINSCSITTVTQLFTIDI